MGKQVEVKVDDRSDAMGAYLAEPAQKAKVGIVVIQEILGVNQDIRDMTEAWTKQGYAAIAPDLFWRLKRGIELDADVPAEFQQALDYLGKFDMDRGIKDIAACIQYLRDQGCTKVGAVGYCMGGRLAFMTATRTSSDATTAYYGVMLDGLLGEAGNIKKPLLMHIATKDRFVPAEVQAKVHAALDGKSGVRLYDYEADHAFARHSGLSRVPALADEADKRTRDFFAANLT